MSETLIPDYVQALMGHALPTPKQERELLRRIQADPDDEAAKELLVRYFVRLLHQHAWRWRNQRGVVVGYEDAFQAAAMGLLRAAETYDVERGLRFSTYAVPWVQETIRRLAMEHGYEGMRLSRHVATRRQQIGAAARKFEDREGRLPTNEELSQLTGISFKHVEEARAALVVAFSLDAKLRSATSETSDTTLGDTVASGLAVPDDETERALLVADVEDAMLALTEQQRLIVSLKHGLHGDALSVEEIAHELDLAAGRVRQLLAEAEDVLRELLAVHREGVA